MISVLWIIYAQALILCARKKETKGKGSKMIDIILLMGMFVRALEMTRWRKIWEKNKEQNSVVSPPCWSGGAPERTPLLAQQVRFRMLLEVRESCRCLSSAFPHGLWKPSIGLVSVKLRSPWSNSLRRGKWAAISPRHFGTHKCEILVKLL